MFRKRKPGGKFGAGKKLLRQSEKKGLLAPLVKGKIQFWELCSTVKNKASLNGLKDLEMWF
jgi:hypothetical protein